MWFITWDPTQPVASRPLAIRTAGNITQPIQWSSEYHDPETALIYYNYRYYNPLDGRWMRRDPIGIEGGVNLYAYVKNASLKESDQLGNSSDNDCAQKCQGASRCKKDDKQCCIKKTTRSNGKLPTVNGCGSEGGMKFPEQFSMFEREFSFTNACNKHDRCYGTCGNRKSACDDEFYNDMYRECINAMRGYLLGDFAMTSVCQTLAFAYYAAVVIRGRDPYESAQDGACEWEIC